MLQKQKLFAIKDSKGEQFFKPFTSETSASAEREFTTLVNDESKQSNVSKYPEDFDLYELGDYEISTGKIMPLEAPKHVKHAALLVTKN